MGGPGSGFYIRWGRKATAEEQLRIDIRWMKQQGRLSPGTASSLSWSCRGEESGSIRYRMYADHMVLIYRVRSRGGDWEDVQQVVRFDRTPCHFGGYRTWLLCPRCGKRVAVLYGAGKYFWCRHCHDLTYSSQQEDRPDRLLRKARKIRKRLGASDDLIEPIWHRPKGMHQKTFDRLRVAAEIANANAWYIMGQKLEFLSPI